MGDGTPEPTTDQRALAALLERIEMSPDPDSDIFRELIRSIEDRDPAFGDVIRCGAVARGLDVEIVGVLRGQPEDVAGNRSYLDRMRDLSFARPGPNGTLTYNGVANTVLLNDWKSKQVHRFYELNGRLADMFARRHREALELEAHLRHAAALVQRANLSRYAQLARAVEDRLVAPLLEALYHRAMRSADEAYELYEQLYQDYEAMGRPTIGETLFRATRTYIEQAGLDGSDNRLRGLAIWEAQIATINREFDHAEALLTGLLAEPDLSYPLRLFALDGLWRNQQGQDRLPQALVTARTLVELAEYVDAGPAELALDYHQLAQMHWRLAELEEATDSYRRAVVHAEEAGHPLTEVYSRLDLAGVLNAQGLRDEALEQGLAAMHLVRTAYWSRRDLYRAVASRLAWTVVDEDPALADSFLGEYRMFRTDVGDSVEGALAWVDLIEVLKGSGQLTRADDELQDLQAANPDLSDDRLAVAMFTFEADLRSSQGREAEAITLYSRAIERLGRSHSTRRARASLLTQRGHQRSDTGALTEARQDLEAALELWQEAGHDHEVALTRVRLADVSRKQGDAERASGMLEEARARLEGVRHWSSSLYHRTRGLLQSDHGDWKGAERELGLAKSISDSIADRSWGAYTSLDLAGLGWMKGHMASAARWSAEAASQFRRLADLDMYRPSRQVLAADEDNARGIRQLAEETGNVDDHVEAAVRLFEASVAKVPDNPLYSLNLSYALAVRKRWKEAADVLHDALDRATHRMPAAFLRDRLVDHRLSQGDSLIARGEYEAAATCFAGIGDEIGAAAPGDRLARARLGHGDALMKLARLDDARDTFRSGLDLAGGDHPALRALLFGRLALVAAFQRDLGTAAQLLYEGFDALEAQGDEVDFSQVMFGDHGDLINDADGYRLASDFLLLASHGPDVPSERRRTLGAAHRDLARSQYHLVRPSEIPWSRLAEVSVTVELDDALFAAGDWTPEARRLLDGDLPRIRADVHDRTGVSIPEPKVHRFSDMLGGHYWLLINNVRRGQGRALAGHRFCPDRPTCVAAGLAGSEAANPCDGTQGVWLPEPVWRDAESRALPLWHPYEFIARHLDAVIRQNLHVFLGYQELQLELAAWADAAGGGPERGALLRAALAPEGAAVRLTVALQTLLAEGVPIKNLHAILEAFVGHDEGADREGLLAALRQAALS